MDRIDRLQENTLVARLKQAKLDLDTLKTAQRTGSDAVVIRRVVSGNTVDFSLTFGYHDLRIFELTITPADATFPNAGFIWAVYYTGSMVSGSGNYQTYIESQPDVSVGEKNRFYMMGITPGATMTWNIRYVIYAIGDVDVSIAQIA